MLKIQNLNKSFINKSILKNISLEVHYGEIAILLGSSGVGKSTLLRILNNLDGYNSGKIEFEGKNLDYDKHVGMVFQNFHLFEHLTCEQNITLALIKRDKKTRDEAKQIAQQLLQKYGLHNKAKTYVSQLSGGQKQRLAIARTLAIKPKIICLDEPTSSLDPQLTNQVAQIIIDLALDKHILLIASHDTELLRQLQKNNAKGKVYLLKNQEIIETVDIVNLTNPAYSKHINSFIQGMF